MDLRYMGFDQKQNTRTYKFDRVAKGAPTERIVVTADIALFLSHHVGIQEGPTLCARKLSADLEGSLEASHVLTNDDLVAYTSARADAEARKAALRRSVPRPRPTA